MFELFHILQVYSTHTPTFCQVSNLVISNTWQLAVTGCFQTCTPGHLQLYQIIGIQVVYMGTCQQIFKELNILPQVQRYVLQFLKLTIYKGLHSAVTKKILTILYRILIQPFLEFMVFEGDFLFYLNNQLQKRVNIIFIYLKHLFLL